MKDLARFNSRREADQLVMVLRDHGVEAGIDSLVVTSALHRVFVKVLGNASRP